MGGIDIAVEHGAVLEVDVGAVLAPLDADHGGGVLEEQPGGLGVVAVAGLIQALHNVQLLPCAEDQVRLGGGHPAVEGGLVQGLPGAGAVVRVEDHPHVVAPGILDGQKHRLPGGAGAQGGAREQQRLELGDKGLVHILHGQVEVGRVRAVEEVVDAALLRLLRHRQAVADAGVVHVGHVGHVHALAVQIVLHILAEVVLGGLAEKGHVDAHFCHLDGGVGGGAANILGK